MLSKCWDVQRILFYDGGYMHSIDNFIDPHPFLPPSLTKPCFAAQPHNHIRRQRGRLQHLAQARLPIIEGTVPEEAV